MDFLRVWAPALIFNIGIIMLPLPNLPVSSRGQSRKGFSPARVLINMEIISGKPILLNFVYFYSVFFLEYPSLFTFLNACIVLCYIEYIALCSIEYTLTLEYYSIVHSYMKLVYYGVAVAVADPYRDQGYILWNIASVNPLLVELSTDLLGHLQKQKDIKLY